MRKEFDARYSYDFERSFSFIWDRIVEPTITLVYNEIDNDFKKAAKLDFSYKDISDYKNDIKEFYREKREWLKDVYLPHQQNPFLDEHKLGAIWCRTMLAFKPFYFDLKVATKFVEDKFHIEDPYSENPEDIPNNSDWFTKNIYSNYRVAFLVSIGIVYLYLLYDCKEMGKDVPEYLYGAYNYFSSKKTLRCPITTEAHNDFQTSCIISLQKNDVLNRDFDYLTYAIMLFQLEHYNRMCYYLKKHDLSLDLV